MENTKTSYDEIEYLSKSFQNSLPESQATKLKILGFDTPNTKDARVLEIGCSFGGNILTYAMANENSKCVGIDLSSVQINKGKELIKYLGVKNLDLYAMNVIDFDENLGEFDYIICHGVFSWVPKEVQESILKVVKNHLAKNGSAFISYNTYPGWKEIEVLKDIMNFRVDYLNVPNDKKVSYGRGAINFLKESPYVKKIRERVDNIIEKNDYYLYHEYFEDINNPLYLYDFNKMLEEYGLSHVCDTNFSKSFPLIKDEELENKIDAESNGNHIVKEQYYDFYFNTQFRSSLITHKENLEKINISKQINKDDIKQLHLKAVDAKIDKNDNDVVKFIKENYPNSVSAIELLEKFGNGDNTYHKIVGLLYSNSADAFVNEIKVKNCEKPKIKDIYAKYAEYHFSYESPIISFSTFDGKNLELDDKSIYHIMSFYNGERTSNDVADIISELAPENTKEIILEFAKDVKNFIIANLMNE